jgi:NADH:ubiquinone oxidoreductase subunit 6 (subunit J)
MIDHKSINFNLSRDDLVRLNSGQSVSLYTELGTILLTSCVPAIKASTMTETNVYQQITPTSENIKHIGRVLFSKTSGGIKQ